SLPRQQGIAVSGPVLLFALATTVTVALLLGLLASRRSSAGDLQEALSAGARSHTGAPGSHRLRRLLVTGEIATTRVILIGAGLLGRSFLGLVSTSPGFRPDNLITMEFSPPAASWARATEQPGSAQQIDLMNTILSRLGAIPGVERVGL